MPRKDMAIYKDIRLKCFMIRRSESGSFISRLVIISIFVGITWSLTACNAALTNKSTCVSCHVNLKPASKSHLSCVECHGGDNQTEDKNTSHRLMYGPKNPSAPNFWEQTCGKCHPYHLQRVRANIMHTNTGMIKNIQKTWEGEDG